MGRNPNNAASLMLKNCNELGLSETKVETKDVPGGETDLVVRTGGMIFEQKQRKEREKKR